MQNEKYLKIGKKYRVALPMQESVKILDGYENFYYITKVSTRETSFKSDSGIGDFGEVDCVDGKRRPVVFFTSTPKKAGKKDTPWHDIIDPDKGYIHYYGDNKYPGRPPHSTRGNGIIYQIRQNYTSGDFFERQKAVPIVFLERLPLGNKPKGLIRFNGFGIVESIDIVTQRNDDGEYFSNFLYHCCVLSLSDDNELFDWRWIADRCDSTKSIESTLNYAPKSWIKWIKGKTSLHFLRRNVSNFGIVKPDEQKQMSMRKKKILNEIYEYYADKKHMFECLAMEVTLKTIKESVATCKTGWVTQKAGDGGIDFVLRIDVGTDPLASVKIVVLGQAKCIKPTTPTNGTDIARTVARMKRGWIGSFVTTSYFSDAVQKEVREDEYPIMLINGAKIADIVENELLKSPGLTLNDYLDSIEDEYIDKRLAKAPETILLE